MKLNVEVKVFLLLMNENEAYSYSIFHPIFIGPRYTWGPIYGYKCLKHTEVFETYADTNSIPTEKNNYKQRGNTSGATWWPNL